jgi:subtilisin family serine protease
MWKLIILTLALAVFAHSSADLNKIEASLKSKLAEASTADVLISFKSGTKSVIEAFTSAAPLSTRKHKKEELVSTLEHHAESAQRNVREFLTARASRMRSQALVVESLWITNQILVRNADAELISSLAAMDEVSAIQLNAVIQIEEPIKMEESYGHAQEQELTWGLQNIQVSKVWNILGGNSGEGVVIGAIDTGVRGTHECLKDNYVGGYYGWYDPYAYTCSPYDNNGHGTHVTGTMVGKLGIGVAPEAKWMHCLGCGPGGCDFYALIMCGQFMMCPFRCDGTQRDCTQAPPIVSNSWAGGQNYPFFVPVIDAWHAAGIIPVFGAGNTGSACGTAQSPGDYLNVIAVGATTSTNGLAYFSARGPSLAGALKPDISAPGDGIKSATQVSDKSYGVWSGTSMAAPHVSGIIALLKSAYPDLTYEDARAYLFDGAEQNLKFSNISCGGIRDTEFPNNHFGHGKVNALKSFIRLLKDQHKLCDLIPIFCDFIC